MRRISKILIIVSTFLFIGFISCSEKHNSSDKKKISLWPDGPFIKYQDNPILRPTTKFEADKVYNPSVIVEDGRFSMLYRAEGINTGTGVICLAYSEDGFNFQRYQNNPVLVAEHEYEREGVEDPRMVKFGQKYYLTYVGAGDQTPGNICLAISSDLISWEKKGEILQPKSNAWNSRQLKAGAIVPDSVNGKYLMYFQGEKEPWKTRIGIAYSHDLVHWYEPIDTPVMKPRPGHFDSMGTEPGAAMIIDDGILLIYNGWNEDRVHKTGWIVFSAQDPTQILARCEEPLLESEEEWEGHILFTESIVKSNNSWFLHYGVVDSFISVATYTGADPRLKNQMLP